MFSWVITNLDGINKCQPTTLIAFSKELAQFKKQNPNLDFNFLTETNLDVLKYKANFFVSPENFFSQHEITAINAANECIKNYKNQSINQNEYLASYPIIFNACRIRMNHQRYIDCLMQLNTTNDEKSLFEKSKKNVLENNKRKIDEIKEQWFSRKHYANTPCDALLNLAKTLEELERYMESGYSELRMIKDMNKHKKEVYIRLKSITTEKLDEMEQHLDSLKKLLQQEYEKIAQSMLDRLELLPKEFFNTTGHDPDTVYNDDLILNTLTKLIPHGLNKNLICLLPERKRLVHSMIGPIIDYIGKHGNETQKKKRLDLFGNNEHNGFISIPTGENERKIVVTKNDLSLSFYEISKESLTEGIDQTKLSDEQVNNIGSLPYQNGPENSNSSLNCSFIILEKSESDEYDHFACTIKLNEINVTPINEKIDREFEYIFSSLESDIINIDSDKYFQSEEYKNQFRHEVKKLLLENHKDNTSNITKIAYSNAAKNIIESEAENKFKLEEEKKLYIDISKEFLMHENIPLEGDDGLMAYAFSFTNKFNADILLFMKYLKTDDEKSNFINKAKENLLDKIKDKKITSKSTSNESLKMLLNETFIDITTKKLEIKNPDIFKKIAMNHLYNNTDNYCLHEIIEFVSSYMELHNNTENNFDLDTGKFNNYVNNTNRLKSDMTNLLINTQKRICESQNNYCSFFSSEATKNKLNALDKNSRELVDIHSLQKLEIFVEKMIYDKDITRKRGFFGCFSPFKSTLHKQLENFHQTNFKANETSAVSCCFAAPN